ncbi:MAG: hypothetical protein P1U56_15665, partial [Saprospiraceae bacterium]|nr:hypothetical protein [Saprospiraceae bacterium]
MKPFYKLLLAALVSVCLQLNAQAFQSPTLPYDLFFVGIDSDINSSGDDQLILMTSRDITSGYQFGISNGLSNNGQWESREASMEYINITYLSNDIIPKGAALKIDFSSSAIEIESNGKSITGDFSIVYSSNYNGDFVKASSFYVSIFNGIMTGSGTKHNLLGSTLDVLAYGITPVESQALTLSRTVENKEVLIQTQTGSSLAKRVDIQNCDLCDILLLILYSDDWLDLPNTFGFDLSAIPFDIRDCIQVDCGGDILIDTIDCYNLSISSIPCDTIVSYEWSKVIDSQFFILESGSSGPIPDLSVKSKVLHQLTVICSDGCTYTYDYYPDCWEDGCDFNIAVDANNCILTVTMDGCANPEYQWNVITGEGSYIIANSNAPSIIAEQNGTYFVDILGCPDCEVASSDTISVNCGETCNCSINFYEDECLLYLNDIDCNEYIGELYYSPDFGMNWYFIDVSSFPFDPSPYGNGSYKYVMANSDCEYIESEVYLECYTPCDIIYLTSSFNQECNLTFNWLDCSNPELQILYANDCLNYTPGGATLISLVSLPDGSGWAEYEADHTSGCYQLQMQCNEDCEVKSDSLEVDDCCTSSFEIVDTNCSLSGINIPCTGMFSYTILENGIIIQSGQGTSLPAVNVNNNAIYQITIECGGCTYYSNSMSLNCGDCDVNPLLSIEDCILIATVENCTNPQIQWQIKENGIWVDIAGANGNVYEIVEDGTYQYLVSGCGCTDEPIDSDDYYSSCFLPCDCYIDISLDTVNCIINSNDPNCDLIISTEWFVFIDNTWLHLPQFSGSNSIIPEFNGVYKKEITTKNCGIKKEEINVSCIIDCDELDVWLISNECTITVQWEGCFGQNNFLWTMTPASQNCGTSGIPASPDYEIISQTGSPLDGIGSMEILPSVDGCYTFTITCNANCTDSISSN